MPEHVRQMSCKSSSSQSGIFSRSSCKTHVSDVEVNQLHLINNSPPTAVLVVEIPSAFHRPHFAPSFPALRVSLIRQLLGKV